MNTKYPLIILTLALLVSQTVFAGTSDHGGNSIVDRILLGRFFAKKIVSTSKDLRLSPINKIKMIEVLNGALNISKNPVKVTDKQGAYREVFAKYDSNINEITYNENWIRSANLAVFETTILSLHEAGHSVGLSKNMAETRADFVNDIGYQLLLEGLNSKEDALSQKIFSDAQNSKRGITCKIGLGRFDGSVFQKTVYRSGEEIQKDNIILSEDVLPGVNVHIFYQANYASINVFNEETKAYVNSDTAIQPNQGNMFSVRSKQPFANILSSVAVVCTLD